MSLGYRVGVGLQLEGLGFRVEGVDGAGMDLGPEAGLFPTHPLDYLPDLQARTSASTRGTH